MIVEYIRYNIDDGRADAFEQAYRRAAQALDSSQHCQRYEISRCSDDPTPARRPDRMGLRAGPPVRLPPEPRVPQLLRSGRAVRERHRGDASLPGDVREQRLTVMAQADETAAEFESRVDETLQTTCELARALIGAHQAAMGLIVAGDWPHARKYFPLSEKYAAFRDFAMPARGIGLHALVVAENTALRLTQAEVERHPAWRG